MSGARLRTLSVGLGLVLMVIVGGIVALVVTQSPPAVVPTPLGVVSPSPTGSPAVSPAPALSPALSPVLSPPPEPSPPPLAPTPLISPAGGATPAPEVTPTPAVMPTSEPAPIPAAPTRVVTFAGLGLDSSEHPEEEVIPRFFTFSVEGPGRITAQLSEATGRVRACLWRGDTQVVADQECQAIRRGTIERDVAAGNAQPWTLSLIGSQVGVSPSLTLRLSFPTNDPAVHLEGFRFQGTDIDNYNGFSAEIRVAAAGSLRVAGSFAADEGGAHSYRLIIEEIGGGPAQPFLEEGEAQSFDTSIDATAERRYRITLENTQRVAEQRILLGADLDWP